MPRVQREANVTWEGNVARGSGAISAATGAFDSLQRNRASLVASIDRAFEYANTREANANQGGLFDMADSHAASTQEPDLVEAMPWGVKERLTLEKTAIGFYLSGHLFDEVELEVRRFIKRRIDVGSGQARHRAGARNDGDTGFFRPLIEG